MEAFHQGRTAFTACRAEIDNPYKRGTREWREWRRGYRAELSILRMWSR